MSSEGLRRPVRAFQWDLARQVERLDLLLGAAAALCRMGLRRALSPSGGCGGVPEPAWSRPRRRVQLQTVSPTGGFRDEERHSSRADRQSSRSHPISHQDAGVARSQRTPRRQGRPARARTDLPAASAHAGSCRHAAARHGAVLHGRQSARRPRRIVSPREMSPLPCGRGPKRARGSFCAGMWTNCTHWPPAHGAAHGTVGGHAGAAAGCHTAVAAKRDGLRLVLLPVRPPSTRRIAQLRRSGSWLRRYKSAESSTGVAQ